jgi:5-(carboxyamino)imidazole ribonucleotide mutase
MAKVKRKKTTKLVPLVAILMGSKSDYPVMKGACEILEEFGVGHLVEVVSAHRTPKRLIEFSESARDKGFKVIIAGAGGAAHLPGMVAASTTLPVIGVPILSSNSLQGLDSLLSIVQMPTGVPVATVAVGGAKNAALLALQILAVYDGALAKKLELHKRVMIEQVSKMNKSL